MYRTVYDLDKAEMDELRDAMFWADDADEVLGDDINYPWEIPDEAIFLHFEGISFCDEDFFCNITDGNYEGCGAAYTC